MAELDAWFGRADPTLNLLAEVAELLEWAFQADVELASSKHAGADPMETELNSDATSAEDEPSSAARKPLLVTQVTVALCVANFAFLTMQGEHDWDKLSAFGIATGFSIWNGQFWVLVTSAFAHLDLWHVAFNVYWLWVLGSRLEIALGSLHFLVFLLAAAFVSAAWQLAVSGDSGIGMSGVVYAIFGYMWFSVGKYPQFKEALDARTAQIFFIWLVGCIVVTHMGTWNVANTAHVTGLLFGCALAGLLERRWPRVAMATLAALVAMAVVAPFWCPWSTPWLSAKAYQAHLAEDYDRAIAYYSRVIDHDPQNAWAYWNRGEAHASLGDEKDAARDKGRATDLEPSYAEEAE